MEGSNLIKMGFLRFYADSFKEILNIAAEVHKTEDEIKNIIQHLTKYTNKLLNLPVNSEKYEINVIDYTEFEQLYRSIIRDDGGC